MSELIKYIESDELEKLQKNAEILKFLNKHPRKEWIKQHPFAKNVDYLPVGKVEMLLDIVFGHWNYEVVDYKLVANSLCVHIRLTVVNPMTNITIIRDGLGAVPLELQADEYEKDSSGKFVLDENGKKVVKVPGARNSIDFERLSRMAVMKNLPAAKSFALKDAADTLGNLFGRSLNRKEKEEFVNMYDSPKFDKFDELVRQKIDSFTDGDDLLEWAGSQSQLHMDKDFEDYVNKKRIELQNGAK